jgi:flagellar biosynthesis protein FlhB
MAFEQELDRHEQATPHKLCEARKRGQVAKSADLVSAGVFAVCIVYLHARGWEELQTQFRFDRLLFAQAAMLDASPTALWRLVQHVVRATMALLLPPLMAIVIAAVVTNLAQTGPMFSLTPLSPQWERIHPGKGLKKLLSGRTMFDAARACTKLVVLCWAACLSLKAMLSQVNWLADLAPAAYTKLLVTGIAALGLKLALVLMGLAAVDLAYSRREFFKKMLMSRRELRDEVKHREGDPRVRARLRELRRGMLRRTVALRRTRQADVLVTNPTHYAVALRYRHGEMEAPRLVSKGAGAMAMAMRTMAARHRIPVVQNPVLARALYAHTEPDQYVPTDLYSQVARLMVWVLAMRQHRGESARDLP